MATREVFQECQPGIFSSPLALPIERLSPPLPRAHLLGWVVAFLEHDAKPIDPARCLALRRER